MANRYWNGHCWRRLSDVEARFRRARGETVVDDAAPTAPPAPVVESHAAEFAAAVSAPPAPFVEAIDVYVTPEEFADLTEGDLTDEELERLTAPQPAAVAAVEPPVRRCSACGEAGHTKRNCPTGAPGEE